MNHSGDAAEQIVRMSLEGVEVAAKITGTAAKEIAILIAAALKSKGSSLKLKGKARMASMLKSGKALEIFSVKESDLRKFAEGAKQYGIVYCVLRNTKHSPDGLCDVMVKAEDAPKINRVVERFKFATVDKAKIESEIVAAKAEKPITAQPEKTAGTESPNKNDTDKLVDDLMGTTEGQRDAAPNFAHGAGRGAEPETPTPAKDAPVNPKVAETAKPRLSEPTSESRSKSARGTSSKPSVKEELREIKATRKENDADAPKRDERMVADKPRDNPATTHKQPQNNRKSKSKKVKGAR